MLRIYPRLILLFTSFLLLVGLSAQEFEYYLKGEVVDEVRGEPLSGVIVLIVGTSSGVITDSNGNFELKVPQADEVTLLVSYTGFSDQELKLELPQPQRLKIILGEHPNYVTCVFGPPAVHPINQSPPGYYPHPALALRGRVPGLLVTQADNDPWDRPQVRALGIHTLTQNAQPLWDIEGLPATDPLLYDGLGLEQVSLLQSPVDLLPYGLQGGSGVLRATVQHPRDSTPGWTHRYRTQTTYARPQRLPEVASAQAYRARWPGRSDLGFATDWLQEVTRRSWSHDHHWRSSYVGKDWYLRGNVNYRNAQGVGRNSQWQQLGGQLLGYRSFFAQRLELEVQLVGNRRWGERDYHETFFQAAKYNPTAPIRFTERPVDNVFLEGMYAFGQASLNNFFEVVTSADLFNPVAMQAANRLLETRVNQSAQAKLQWKIASGVQLEVRAARQASDQLAGEENTVNAYFRGNATTLRSGAAGRWAWERRQELVQAKLRYGWQSHKTKVSTEGSYRFQRFRFGNENSWGMGFADNNFAYNNFESRLATQSLLAQYENTETHRLIDFLLHHTVEHEAGIKWRTALLYQGSTRLGPDHRWHPLIATDLDLQLGRLLGVQQLDPLHLQLGYGTLGGLPQNEEAFQGQYNRGQPLPLINNRQLRPERRQLLNLGLVWQDYNARFELLYQYSQTRDLISTQLGISSAGVTEVVGTNLRQTKLVNGSLGGRFTYRQSIGGLSWHTELHASYVRTHLRPTRGGDPDGYFEGGDYRVVETANLRVENGGLGIAVLQLDAPFGQLLGRQYDLPATQAAGEFVIADRFAGAALGPTSAYGIVGNGLPTSSWSWRNRLSSKRWVLDFQFRADLGHELAHLRRGELEYTIPQETIFPSSRNYFSTEYDLEGVAGFPAFTDYYVEHANYLSLDYVSLAYRVQRKGAPFCTLSLTGQNLALWTNYTGVDPSPRLVDTGLAWNGNPSVPGAAGQLAPGIDRRAFYPRATMVSLGVGLAL